MNIFAYENDLNKSSEFSFLEMPRWQRGYASGCRPEDGSSNIGVQNRSTSYHSSVRETPLLPNHQSFVKVSLPRGSKILFMLSGGIDSPVAIKLAKRFYDVTPVHFALFAYYPKNYKKRFVEFLEIVMKSATIEKIMVIPFSNVLKKISIYGKRKYVCLLCRKSMLRACELLCSIYGFDAIGTGEVLAQKASQTIYNMHATHFGLKKPVIHPLLCMDKEEIVKLARKFGISVEKHLGACRLVPRYPVTKATPEKLEQMYREIELDELINEVVKNVFWVRDPREFEEVIE